jgi:predicted transcriptional regulator
MKDKVLLADLETIPNLVRALDSSLRLRILRLLTDRELNVNRIAELLQVPQSTAAVNVQMLERVGLLTCRQQPATKGSQKLCQARVEEVVLFLREQEERATQNTIEVEMPVGLFFDYHVSAPCGLASERGMIGYLDQPESFTDPHRAKAGLLWFESGYLEYRLPFGTHHAKRARSLAISAELCSEFPTHNDRWPSDVTLWINDREIGTWTSPGDMADRRGYLNPEWWNDTNTQYGFLKEWRVTDEGSMIDGIRASETALSDLNLEEEGTCRVRIGIKENADNRGGLNLFGKGFGNYPQDIRLRVELENGG